MVSAIAAMSQNNVIGKDNELPWSISEDMEWFKRNTTGKPIIMGKKTYESIGRPLPKRTNVVLTRNHNVEIPGVVIYHDLEDAVKRYNEENPFVIGGGEVYKQAFDKDLIDKVYLTVVFKDFEGDAFFPDLDKDKWTKTYSTVAQKSKKGLTYAFYIFERTK